VLFGLTEIEEKEMLINFKSTIIPLSFLNTILIGKKKEEATMSSLITHHLLNSNSNKKSAKILQLGSIHKLGK
jgi:hypothetical protein